MKKIDNVDTLRIGDRVTVAGKGSEFEGVVEAVIRDGVMMREPEDTILVPMYQYHLSEWEVFKNE